jgi:hypothetical protein
MLSLSVCALCPQRGTGATAIAASSRNRHHSAGRQRGEKLLALAVEHISSLRRDAERGPSDGSTGRAYEAFASALSLSDPSVRGSGTATVVAALAIAAAYPDDPAAAARLAANAVGTDTDTIATMAAAIVGACSTAQEPTVLDGPYLAAEADRLAALAGGRPTSAFDYPDLLTWSPPQTQLDATGLADGRLALAGIGWLSPSQRCQPSPHATRHGVGHGATLDSRSSSNDARTSSQCEPATGPLVETCRPERTPATPIGHLFVSSNST